MNQAVVHRSAPLSRSLLAVLAAGAGLSAATLYYNQPVLGAIARDLGVSARDVGVVPTTTQLGYAAGILAFAPLGDRYDKRRIVVAKLVALVVALVVAGLAPSIAVLSAASLVVGLAATAAQDFVPIAATLAAPTARGKTVGVVMTGLLLGILTSRLASGVVGDALGWRAVYFGAAASVAVLAVVSSFALPVLAPTTDASYFALLRSIGGLVREHAPLRRAALAQALLSMAFSGFWSTLALVLAAPPFGLGASVAGAFGLAGAVGALAAPLAGTLADRRGPGAVVVAGASLVVASFVAMGIFPSSIAVLVVTTVLFDLGVHASLVSHQTIVYGLAPEARSRLNAVLVSAMFFGMASGALVANRAFAAYGFVGVATFGAAAALAALVVRVLRARPALARTGA